MCITSKDAYEYEHTVDVMACGRKVWTVVLIVNGSPVSRAVGATHSIAERACREAYERVYVPALGRPRPLGK
jgi:hypothetical protein